MTLGDQSELYEYENDPHEPVGPNGLDQCPECGDTLDRNELVQGSTGRLYRSFEAAEPGRKLFHPDCWDSRRRRIEKRWQEYEQAIRGYCR